jgi:hypothetical protein
MLLTISSILLGLVSDINKRRRTVALALGEIEGKLHELKSEGRNNKDEEKRARLLEAQLQILKQMNTHLRRDFLPEQLTNVQVEVSGSTQATIEFDPPAAESNGCLVTKYLGMS